MAGQRHRREGGWHAAAAIADNQHGVVSRDQLRGCGFSEAAIDHGLVSGRVHPVFRSVFALGHPGVGWRGKMLAATLASGDGSVVSHGTAAFLLGLWERRPESIDIIGPVESGRKHSGIRRRFVPPPEPADCWIHDGVSCTSPSRTIIDIAGIVGEAALRRTVEQAAVNRLLDVSRIDAILDGPRRRGSRQLRFVLEGWRRYSPHARLRSVLEAKLLSLLALHGLPAPECNARLCVGAQTFEVDFLWRSKRVVVETDGRRFHDNPEAQVRDRLRDGVLSDAGYRIERLGWEDLEHRPEATLARLSRLLRSAVP